MDALETVVPDCEARWVQLSTFLSPGVWRRHRRAAGCVGCRFWSWRSGQLAGPEEVGWLSQRGVCEGLEMLAVTQRKAVNVVGWTTGTGYFFFLPVGILDIPGDVCPVDQRSGWWKGAVHFHPPFDKDAGRARAVANEGMFAIAVQPWRRGRGCRHPLSSSHRLFLPLFRCLRWL